MTTRSKLLRMKVRNVGCIGNEGVTIELDDIVCLVGKNNSGKSTILRAYELAKGDVGFQQSDRCQFAPADEPSEIEMEVHIPEGVSNLAAKWKQQIGDLLVVKNRWQWRLPDLQLVRQTWLPTGGPDGAGCWAEEEKGGGADNVFSARLPKPLRISSLQGASAAEQNLLTLVLQPFVSRLEREQADKDSKLGKALAGLMADIEAMSKEHIDHFNRIATKVGTGFKGVFPNLGVEIDVKSAPLNHKIKSMIEGASALKVRDGSLLTSLEQQGAGAQRALFWAMLQVHNELSLEKDVREEHKKKLKKDIESEEKKKKAKGASPEEVEACGAKINELTSKLENHIAGAPIPQDANDPALPGYLLLIDEPENALHPLAARAAQRHLYQLAQSADWQVMMTTHSPYFINPFEDHTTVVRLDRGAGEKSPITPKTYRSDLVTFEGDDKKRLQALQHIDPSLSEIFFGSYPILVEGDTEHAAFMAAIIEKRHELMDQVTVVRARGKAILVPLISIMRHFKIDFGILHDLDAPRKRNGDKNGMWTINSKIRAGVEMARGAGLNVRHRVSVPDFERLLAGDAEDKDKPLIAYQRVTEEEDLSETIQSLLTALMSSDDIDPFPGLAEDGVEYEGVIRAHVQRWAELHGLADDIRFREPA